MIKVQKFLLSERFNGKNYGRAWIDKSLEYEPKDRFGGLLCVVNVAQNLGEKGSRV